MNKFLIILLLLFLSACSKDNPLGTSNTVTPVNNNASNIDSVWITNIKSNSITLNWRYLTSNQLNSQTDIWRNSNIDPAYINIKNVAETNPTISGSYSIFSYTDSLLTDSSTFNYSLRPFRTLTNNTTTPVVYASQKSVTTTTRQDPTIVIINGLKWSSKNLDVRTYRDGTPIPQVTDPTAWSTLTTGAWCWYNNDSATYAAKYGRLYNWYAVNDPRGLAPTGWRVANIADLNFFTNLPIFYDGRTMKSVNGWNTNTTVVNTNSTGFSALPGGIRFANGVFYFEGNAGLWWLADVSPNGGLPFGYRLDYSTISLAIGNLGEKVCGASVRCIRN